MEPYTPTPEPDEGYSEHPLYPSSGDNNNNNNVPSPSNLRSPADFAAWLNPRISSMTVAQKKALAMALLEDLPTTVIAEIVMTQLNPRLYIDFIEYLPTEICLKILGYLDPVSLINVAKSCRGWYNLALDRKLWEKLYYLEGWSALESEIAAAEQRMNSGLEAPEAVQRLRSSEDGHAHKKRAVSEPLTQPVDDGEMDIDADMKQEPLDTEMSGSSLFGGPYRGETGSSSKSTASVIRHLGDLMMDSPSPIAESSAGGSLQAPADVKVDVKGKGKAVASASDSPVLSSIPLVRPILPKSSLWMYDAKDMRYKINWQYLYLMRRRLESNWERGKYSNFQLPHPSHPEEGHGECIYSIQYNADYLVSGSRDKTLRIWNLRTRRLVRPPLRGHEGSVLCLQFDADPEEDIIVSGSSDSTIIIWKFSTGAMVQRITTAHQESVLNVKFDRRILVTCSKDKTIKIFNRRPLRAGDPGYGEVSPVPTTLKNYDYGDSPLDQLPVKPPYTMIGSLVGHGAAVNAVQICGDEVVSASGDRHIKVWDWTHQVCKRTIMGHNKGIACVQYDGRRIVSGSSDNEVKIYDRSTGVEVASLRAHSSLVRTVQAGFGDLPYSIEEDRKSAREIDEEYFRAVETGKLNAMATTRGRAHNAGSRRPEDITAYGAALPPGGGGGPYARIVSGSYDTTIIIWRRDKDGVWRDSRILRQEDAAAAAMRTRNWPPLGMTNAMPALHHNVQPVPSQPAAASSISAPRTTSFTHVEQPIHATITPQTTVSYTQMIDSAVQQGPNALFAALNSFPTMLTYQAHITAAIELEPNAVTRSQLRQAVTTALVRAQIAQSRIRGQMHRALTTGSQPIAQSSQTPAQQSSISQQGRGRQLQGPSTHRPLNAGQGAAAAATAADPEAGDMANAAANADTDADAGSPVAAGPSDVANGTTQPEQTPQQAQSQLASQVQQLQTIGQPFAGPPAGFQIPARRHPHIAQTDANPARVFKLQFDARRIICCSQTSTIVGWDFVNGDQELEEASRFFGTVE